MAKKQNKQVKEESLKKSLLYLTPLVVEIK